MNLRITETDQEWVSGFKAMIVKEHNAQPTDDSNVFAVTEDLSAFYHGCKLMSVLMLVTDDGEITKSWAEQYPDVIEWLTKYNGNFDFYVSLKKQYATKGELSEKQTDAVLRAIARDGEQAAQKAVQAAQPKQEFSIKVGEFIRVGKWMGQQIAEKAGLTKPHFVMEVMEVHGESDAAYHLTLKLSAQRTSHCCICNLKLTNKASVIAGIGPICAEKWGVGFGGGSLEELSARLQTIQSVKTWMPKSSIKERISHGL